MIRLICAASAGIGCALFGLRMAQKLVRREEALASWLRTLDGLAAALGYVDDPLPDVIERLAVRDTPGDARLAAALTTAVDAMRADRSLGFGGALPLDVALSDLDPADAAALLPLIRELGTTARPQQMARIDSARASLRAQAASAADLTRRQKRLFVSLGSLGGLALFLCLIG